MIFAPHAVDFYKTGHPSMFPKGITRLYGNFTPRGDKLAKVLPDFDHKIVWGGLQAVCQTLLIGLWNDSFFSQPKEKVIAKYKRRMDRSLGEDAVGIDRFAALHDLGYLPVAIKALPEGSRVNIRVAPYTIDCTHNDFAWVSQYLETQLSAEIWKFITTATTAYEFRRLLMNYAIETGVDPSFVDFQAHDFSMRGMSGIVDATVSGAAHLLSFKGTDTVSAIDYLEDYYPDPTDPFIGGSVPATEHSVSSSNIICIAAALEADGEWDGWSWDSLVPQKDSPLLEVAETAFLKHMLVNLYPKGIFSYVSDTYDFWAVITTIAMHLKPEIMAREGKVVFRPDSGDPVKIVTGYEVDTLETAWTGSECVIDNHGKYWTVKATEENREGWVLDQELSVIEVMGAVECLWNIFGGTVTSMGLKTLDSHVGLIYGDSISLERAKSILARLKAKGFSSGNIVFGVGSFTYQFVTRDTFGTAIKATFAVIDGVDHELFKDPKTDSGMKKSARGLLRVEQENGNFVQYDRQTRAQESRGELQLMFKDSKMIRMQTLSDIRNRLLAV
jgi:nicotinamide phosphoribosyltransferase